MTHRGWWLVGLNILIPGSAQALAGSRRLGRVGLISTFLLWGLAIVVLVVLSLDRRLVVALAASSLALLVVAVVSIYYGILWIVLTLDTLRLVRFVRVRTAARAGIAGLALTVLVITSGVAGAGALYSLAAARLLGTVFGTGTTIAEPVDGRYNILLLGGDAGPDRLGLRPDSISVASVDADSGAVTLIGVPRNLENAPFREGSPLWGPFPGGYDCGRECLISYLYTYGEEHPDLYPEARDQGSSPGIEAMRDAIEGTLGLTLQYYVLVDMDGFAQLIDALGGIELDVPQRTLLGANTFDDGSPAEPIGVIEAGVQHMDGATALWYARTRYGSNDYERMQRQRDVQEALLAQADPAAVVTNFPRIAEASARVVSTDIPEGMLGHFLTLAGMSREHPITRRDFVPPEVDPHKPDVLAIQAAVDALLAPPPSPGPEAGE